jgi:hypothetical protein
MTIRESIRYPGMRVALAALVVSVAVLAWTLERALRDPEPPAASAPTMAALDPIARAASSTDADIASVAENDVFAPDRSAPSSAYRMPGDDAGDEKAAPDPEKPAVLGTAVATDGRHFATVQFPNAPPKLVHIGDTVGGWIVRAIERGKVVLVTASGSHADITVPKPGT